jgi:hypothetical protein
MVSRSRWEAGSRPNSRTPRAIRPSRRASAVPKPPRRPERSALPAAAPPTGRARKTRRRHQLRRRRPARKRLRAFGNPVPRPRRRMGRGTDRTRQSSRGAIGPQPAMWGAAHAGAPLDCVGASPVRFTAQCAQRRTRLSGGGFGRGERGSRRGGRPERVPARPGRRGRKKGREGGDRPASHCTCGGAEARHRLPSSHAEPHALAQCGLRLRQSLPSPQCRIVVGPFPRLVVSPARASAPAVAPLLAAARIAATPDAARHR